MTPETPRSTARRVLRAVLWIAPIAVAIGVAHHYSLVQALVGKGNAVPTVAARKGALEITVPAEGELSSVRSRPCNPPRIEGFWEFKIVWMAPEGTQVAPGMPVMRLDTQELEKTLKDSRFELETTEQNLGKEEADFQSRLKSAALEIESARTTVEKKRLKTDVDPSLKARIELDEARLDLEIAERRFDAALSKQKALEEEGAAKLAFLRVKRDRASNETAATEQDIGALTLSAPVAGTLIYKSGWRGEKPKVGETIWGGEAVLMVTDLSAMEFTGELQEEDARFVQAGLAAEVVLDAFPERKFPAEIVSVSPFARRKSMDQPTKVFDTKLRLTSTDRDVMRPGMRAKATVFVERLPDVIMAPVDSVFERDGRSIVYVRNGFRFETRPVTTGRKNDTHIVITEGLKPGEEICLERPEKT